MASLEEDREYRDCFVAAQTYIGLPFQLQAMMKRRGWTQQELARRTGMKQPQISALMIPGGSRPSTRTLIRIAKAFDCALDVRFVAFSELIRRSMDEFDPETFDAVSFQEDMKDFMPPSSTERRSKP